MYNEILALYWILQYLAAPPPMWHKGGEGGGGVGPVNVEKSCHGKEGHTPSLVNLHVHVSECLFYMRRNLPLCPSDEPTVALAHALIVLPWPGWANQSVYKEKSWSS